MISEQAAWEARPGQCGAVRVGQRSRGEERKAHRGDCLQGVWAVNGLAHRVQRPPSVMASGVSPASCVEARLSHPECGSAGMSLVEMRSCWGRVSPKPNKTGVLRRRGETQRPTDSRWPCDDGRRQGGVLLEPQRGLAPPPSLSAVPSGAVPRWSVVSRALFPASPIAVKKHVFSQDDRDRRAHVLRVVSGQGRQEGAHVRESVVYGTRWRQMAGLEEDESSFRVCFLCPWPGDVRCVTSGPSGVPLPVSTASPVVCAAFEVGFDTCFAQRFPPVCLVPKSPLSTV